MGNDSKYDQPELVRPEIGAKFAKNCEKDGHLWGPGRRCMFCKREQPKQQPTNVSANPRGLPLNVISVLVSADRCPNCLGELDTGWECNSCGYDAKPWIEASKAKNDRAHDAREG